MTATEVLSPDARRCRKSRAVAVIACASDISRTVLRGEGPTKNRESASSDGAGLTIGAAAPYAGLMRPRLVTLGLVTFGMFATASSIVLALYAAGFVDESEVDGALIGSGLGLCAAGVFTLNGHRRHSQHASSRDRLSLIAS